MADPSVNTKTTIRVTLVLPMLPPSAIEQGMANWTVSPPTRTFCGHIRHYIDDKGHLHISKKDRQLVSMLTESFITFAQGQWQSVEFLEP